MRCRGMLLKSGQLMKQLRKKLRKEVQEATVATAATVP